MKRVAKILIVDDSKFILDMMEKLFFEWGIRDIAKAVNGLLGLELFERALLNGVPYSLVLLDITMPVMDGQEALKRMRGLETREEVTRKNKAVIIMVSGLNSPDDMIEALIEGDGTNYLTKPFNPEDLMALLKKYNFL